MKDLNSLEKENSRLKEYISFLESLLMENNISFSDVKKTNVIEEKKEEIINSNITENHARLFYSYFCGRRDVYAKRSGKPNKITGKYAYYTQCHNFWKSNLCPKANGVKVKCSECKNRNYKELTGNDILAHLKGEKEDCSDVIGMYVTHEDGTCGFLVFDFDDHENVDNNWKQEVNAIRTICSILDIDCLVERSRSGNGAHLWIFFEERITAKLARKFGDVLLNKGAEYINQKDFKSYDRMLPSQDVLPEGGFGNLVALPLQGRALLNKNSAFVDEKFISYRDQWKTLMNTKKMSKQFVDDFIKQYDDLFLNDDNKEEKQTDAIKPWDKKNKQFNKDDVDGILTIYEANRLFIDNSNLKPRLQNKIRRLASFSNPNFYKRQSQGFPVTGISRIISCSRDYDNYISIPKGLKEDLIFNLEASEIKYKVIDKINNGKGINVGFKGQLYSNQIEASDTLLTHNNGILYAIPGFGKTVIGTYLIAKHKVNTLIILDKTSLMKDWEDNIHKFLDINEEYPEYITPSGRKRKRTSLVGKLTSSHNSLTGIIDIVMVSSLGKGDDIKDLVKDYGQVLVDECHHVGATTYDNVLSETNSKYLYGFTATPYRDDELTKKVFMYLGPIRYSYSEKDAVKDQDIPHCIYPRFTRFVYLDDKKIRLDEINKLLVNSEIRNNQIINDVKECVKNKRTPIVMTKDREHVEYLYNRLIGVADKMFVLYGGKSLKEQTLIREEMKDVSDDETMILIATVQFISEGFNFPRLDTLMLTMPISFEGKVKQTAGRLHRKYKNKKDVIIYDYVDIHIPMLERMYNKRIKSYKQMGYEICSSINLLKDDNKNSIFGADDYIGAFENDLKYARNEIIVSSLGLSIKKIKHYIKFFVPILEKGVKVIVLTLDPDCFDEEESKDRINKLILDLKYAGFIVKTSKTNYKKYAVIDKNIVWYGSMNLLSNEKEDNSLMRIQNKEIANELLNDFYKSL